MQLLNIFQNINTFSPEQDDYYIISEINSYEEEGVFTYLHRITALIDPELVPKLKSNSINFQVYGTGPGPFPEDDREYEPIFWIELYLEDQKKPIELKPLVVEWEEANHTVTSLDQGFLMTYGLTPRIHKNSNKLIWDDLSLPRYNVVESKLVSEYDYPHSSHSYVKINKKYIEDYASLTKKSIVQLLFLDRKLKEDNEIAALLDDREQIKDVGKKFYQRVGESEFEEGTYFGELKTYFILAEPSEYPISEKSNVEDLEWKSDKIGHMFEYVYVNDKVLEKYEGKPEYDIHPESGHVSYKNQWSIGKCNRVGRDLIRIELRKLYEGTPAEEINHWHSYATNPPNNLKELRDMENVGSRSKKIVYEFINSGESIASLGKTSSQDIIGYNRDDLDYYGWWKDDNIKRITKHIPKDMDIDVFVQRINDLSSLLIDSLKESVLRKLLIGFGVKGEDISEYKSLKLLDYLIEIIKGVDKTGLSVKDFIDQRQIDLKDSERISKIYLLYTMNEIRHINAHKQSSNWEDELQKHLDDIDIDYHKQGTQLYRVCDKIYDKIYKMLEDINTLISSTSHLQL